MQLIFQSLMPGTAYIVLSSLKEGEVLEGLLQILIQK